MSDSSHITKRTKQISSLTGLSRRPWRQISILLVSILMLVGMVQIVFGQTIDWTTIPRTAPTSGLGWDSSVPVPGPQTFDLGNGISMDVSYNALMWDLIPEIYSVKGSPLPQLDDTLRWTNNHNFVVDPTFAQMVIVFSEPVLLDNFTIGSLSYIDFYAVYEWVDLQAFDQSGVLLSATNYSGFTYEVDTNGDPIGNPAGEIYTDSPFIVDDSSGLYYIRGTSIQPTGGTPCTRQCGYDMAKFEYTAIPVKRIEVQFWLRDTTGDITVPDSGGFGVALESHGSVVFDGIDFTEAQLDWGDLPDTSGGTGTENYETQAADVGPYHVIDGTSYLGSCVDVDSDGQQNTNATGDDADSSTEIGTCIGGDDEDGVIPTGNWSDGTAEIDVTSSTNACLNIWLDYTDGGAGGPDGIFGAPEYVIQNQAVNSGVNNLAFAFPADANDNVTYYLRARLTPEDGGGGCTGVDTYAGGAPIPTGAAIGGEVEDYEINFSPTAIRLDSLESSSVTSTPWVLIVIGGLLMVTTLISVPRWRKE